MPRFEIVVVVEARSKAEALQVLELDENVMDPDIARDRWLSVSEPKIVTEVTP